MYFSIHLHYKIILRDMKGIVCYLLNVKRDHLGNDIFQLYIIRKLGVFIEDKAS